MNTYWKYYFDEAVALYPTIFIGGNHEASNYLWELYYGGWAAPNIYFLGFTGVVKFGNLRIGVYFIAYLLLDTLRGLLIIVILSGHCIMFVIIISTNSCKLRNQLIFFFHMIGLLASLIVGTGRNLFGKNQILRWR